MGRISMPQVSLYLDNATLELIDNAARLSGTSVSKLVKRTVLRSLENNWPEGYFELFGAIDDNSFDVPVDTPKTSTVPRESI